MQRASTVQKLNFRIFYAIQCDELFRNFSLAKMSRYTVLRVIDLNTNAIKLDKQKGARVWLNHALALALALSLAKYVGKLVNNSSCRYSVIDPKSICNDRKKYKLPYHTVVLALFAMQYNGSLNAQHARQHPACISALSMQWPSSTWGAMHMCLG